MKFRTKDLVPESQNIDSLVFKMGHKWLNADTNNINAILHALE